MPAKVHVLCIMLKERRQFVGIRSTYYTQCRLFFCALLRLTTAKRLSQKPEFWAHRPEFFWRNPEFFRRIDLCFFSLRPNFFGA